ncbi:uncharacterized protein LOC106757036 [Vigna radiata var. radiata]|uniref:Uncharacterized protein LOC106757036 n=1 Tax=Vigna radiata var. radiata TaxID=3916 RepID=A0A1S3TMX0_VIGRR|nr:uncharacterized protein LOC106757036 [Vigna radiata var. radiata]
MGSGDLLILQTNTNCFTLISFFLFFSQSDNQSSVSFFMEGYSFDRMFKAECCEICGAIGWKEVLLTCSKCKGGREHAYCTKFHTLIIPEYWVCEPCGSKCVSTSPLKEDRGIGSRASKMYQTSKTAKVKSLTKDEVIRLSSGASHPVSSTIVLGKHRRNDEIHKKTMTSKHASCSLSKGPTKECVEDDIFSESHVGPTKECVEENQKSLGRVIADHNIQDYYSWKEKLANKAPFEASSSRNSSPFADSGPSKICLDKNQRPMGGVAPAKKVQIHDPQKEKPTKAAPFEALFARKSSPIVGSGGIPCANDDGNQFTIKKYDKSIQQSLNLDSKFLPCSITTWRGQFQILHTASPSKFYDGFEAQPPFIVNGKAFAFSREMPSVLQLESRPALKVLIDIFQDDSPQLQDIALYFFPSEKTERSRMNLNSILKLMKDEKTMLRSYINGVELLIFTSNQLGMDSRGAIATINDGHFLWGLFRKKKIDKAIERVPKMEPLDMDFDMWKDAMGRTYQLGLVTPNLGAPPGFEE